MNLELAEPLVSVIMPVYNRKDLLARSICSVLQQSFKKFELIVVDDCSTEDILPELEKFSDERIIYYRLDRNLGPASARNYGISKARGKYIAFQDSDDWWLANKLEKQLKVIELYQGVSGVASDIFYSDKSETIDCRVRKKLSKVKIVEQGLWATPTLIVERSVFGDDSEWFDSSLEIFEDWDFLIRLQNKNRMAYLREPLVLVFNSQSSVSKNVDRLLKSKTQLLAKNKKILNQEDAWYSLIMFNLGHCFLMLDVVKEGRCLFLNAFSRNYSLRCFLRLLISFFGASFYKFCVQLSHKKLLLFKK